MNFFDSVRGKLGFGFMRLPMTDGAVDLETVCRMVDEFMAAGFNYFDTAHGYLDGESERAIAAAVCRRYPRESFMLANKLSSPHFHSREEIRPLFESQLAACETDYFDVYLMHSQDAGVYEKYKALGAYETAYALKREGLVRHVGLSFHDKAEVLSEILREQPEIEIVQIQFNYADYDSPSVEAKKCYDVCRAFGKHVIVMEPVKGGALATLPPTAGAILSSLGEASAASYAIRFAAGFDGVVSVLSGMGSLEMLRDNVSHMKNFVPLNSEEQDVIERVRAELRSLSAIDCTGCRYCTPVCPMKIPIPDLFACMNARMVYADPNAEYYYENHTQDGRLASTCIYCSRCERHCPQHLEIPKLLRDVAREFEK